jgi:hypothetical protein
MGWQYPRTCKEKQRKQELSSPSKAQIARYWHPKHVLMLTNPAGSIEMYLLWGLNKKTLGQPQQSTSSMHS